MPTTTPIHGLQVPVTGDAVNVPGDMLTLGDDVDNLLPVSASTQPSPLAGLIWFNPTTGLSEISDGTSWYPVVGPAPAWTDVTGFATGAGAGSDGCKVRKWANGQVEMRGAINAATTFATGGILLVTLPAGYAPVARWIAAVAWGGTATQTPTLQVDTSGGLTLFCTSGVSNIRVDSVRFWIA